MTGNTFDGSLPLYVTDPDLLSNTAGISGNTYTAADPRIGIRGTLDGQQTMGFVDTLGKYELLGDLNVASNAALTIEPGVALQSRFARQTPIVVQGRLDATGVGFTWIGITVSNAGEANLTDCVLVSSSMRYDAISSGTLLCNLLTGLSIQSDANVFVVHNDVSTGGVSANGTPGARIDLDETIGDFALGGIKRDRAPPSDGFGLDGYV